MLCVPVRVFYFHIKCAHFDIYPASVHPDQQHSGHPSPACRVRSASGVVGDSSIIVMLSLTGPGAG